MQKAPTELIGFPRDVTRCSSAQSRQPEMYRYHMLATYRPFPSVVPVPLAAAAAAAVTERGQGQGKGQGKEQGKEQGRTRGCWYNFRGFFVNGEEAKLKTALVISRPTGFRKTA